MEPHQVNRRFRLGIGDQHIGKGNDPALMAQDGDRLGFDIGGVERTQRKAFFTGLVLG